MGLYGYNCYNFCHNNTFGGSAYVSGTTCDGIVGAFYLTLGQCICMDIDFPFITCDNPIFSGECIPSTPTPTITSSPTATPTLTPTSTITPTPSITATQTQTPTPSLTASPTQTPTPSITATQTQTPSPTLTPSITASPTLTPSITPTMTSTPTPTPCVLDCCFETTAENFTGVTGARVIQFFNDGSLFVGRSNGNWYGTNLGVNNYRFNRCGGSSITAFTTTCTGSLTNAVGYDLLDYQSTGKYIQTYRGRNLFRTNANFTTDTTFNESRSDIPQSTDGIRGIYVNPSDEIFIMGIFSAWTNCTSGGTKTFNTNIYKLDPDGTINTSYSGISLGFTGGASGYETKMTNNNDPNGKVLVLGTNDFTGNTQWRGVWRINTDGTPDPTFNTSLFTGYTPSSFVSSYALPNGKYLVGGTFVNMSGVSTQDYLVRLNSDGTLDTSFVATGLSGGNGCVDIAVDVYGNIYTINNNIIYKLSPNGTLITSRSVTLRTGEPLTAIAVDSCSVYVGGNFTTTNPSNGNVYNGIIKLDLDLNFNMCLYPTPTPTRTPTQTPTPSITPSITPTNTITPTTTPPEPSPSNTPTSTATQTPTNTETPTQTPTITPTITSSPTSTSVTPSPTATATQTPTVTPTIGFYSELFYSGLSSCDGACLLTGSTTLYWSVSAGTALNIGEYAYLDSSLTTPAPNGYYVPSSDTDRWVRMLTGDGLVGSADPNGCTSVECPTPTPTSSPTPTPTYTPTNTQTPTQTLTATNTSTPTNTPTITPSPTTPDNCCYVTISSLNSLDIDITDVKVSGVSVTYISGTNFTIQAGDPSGDFYTFQTGNSVTVDVYFSSSISGQNITLQDCAENIQCYDTTGSGGIASFTGVDLSCGCAWTISAADGACV